MMARFDIDTDLVRKLAQLLEETGLAELEYSAEGRQIRLVRTQPMMVAPAPVAAVPAAGAPGPAQEEAPASAHAGAVTSPMVGTVYVAPEPGAAPFVKTGDAVREGQTLLIIEAMKTMNPIRAPRAGTITQILVVDGAPVEYGEVLLIIQ
jgi:acetyl-CoA carboxylase biotin carboxyl carrier protein